MDEFVAALLNPHQMPADVCCPNFREVVLVLGSKQDLVEGAHVRRDTVVASAKICLNRIGQIL